MPQAVRVALERGVRRVVTGVDAAGRAVIVQDERVTGDPRGLLLWGCDAPPLTANASPPGCAGWWPPPGGVRVSLSTRAPDGSDAAAHNPGDHPFPDIHDKSGFHASASVDVLIMISGRIWLELDDGVKVELQGGDVLVQNGTRHRWRNCSDEWPLMAFVIVGAQDP